MIEQIGAFADQAGGLIGKAGDDRLDRLLAEHLRALRAARREQQRGIGALRIGVPPLLDHLPQPLEGGPEGGGIARGRHPHHRTGMPLAARWAFASPMRWVPKWKIEAASTAAACPARTPSTRWSSVPTPPEAMTGTRTASATARVSARSKPAWVPSRSIEVSRISPAP